MDVRDNGHAILAMMLAMAGFILNDVLVKLSAPHLPLGQIILVRGLICIVLMAGVCQITGAFRHFRHLCHKTVALRTLAEIMATLLYLSALFHLPIANATAILQALPLVVTAGSAVFLKAHVGWRRWTAIGVGFAGVLLIVRPGVEGFNAWSLLAVSAVFFMATRDLTTKSMPKAVPTFGVAFFAVLGVTALGLGMTVVEGWQPMEAMSIFYLTGAAGFILIGYIFIIVAMRSGEISIVAPFRYSIVVWALCLGYFVWGDVPDTLTLLGTIVIVLTGIYTFFREQRSII